jgi:hypothetical protein
MDGRAGMSAAADRRGGPPAAEDRATGQARHDPGPPSVDHHGVGIRHAGTGDRPGWWPRTRTPSAMSSTGSTRSGCGRGTLLGGWPSPPHQSRRRGVHRRDGHGAAQETGPPVHPLEHPQARRLPGHQPGPPGAPGPGTAAATAAPQRYLLPTHPHLKESTDPNKETKLDRIEEVTTRFPDRCFAFDQFGPLSIRPHHGSSWQPKTRPDRLPATYRRTHGIRYFHGCYSLGDDQLWGVTRRRKGGDHTLAAFKVDPGHPPGRRTHLHHLRQPVRQHHPGHPSLGQIEQGRTVPHPDQRILGEPDRGPVRAAALVHHGQLELPQPHRPGPRDAAIPTLAQRQRPPLRRPRRPTPRTRPHPQRTPTTLGPTTTEGRVTAPSRTVLVGAACYI